MKTAQLSRVTIAGLCALALSVTALAKGGSSSATTSVAPILLSYPSISAPAGSIAMTAIGSTNITGTGGTTSGQAWNDATRYMYFDVSNIYQECRLRISGGQLVPNGSAMKTSANNVYTVKQNFYCYSGAYRGWIASHRTMAVSMRVGQTASSEVCLTQAAGAGGVVVKMVGAYGRVSVPSSVTVPAGSTCVNVTFSGVKGSGTEQVFAILNGYAQYIVVDVYQ
ncbi:hypothetical protein [Bdellovibrio sp. HCB2-146]|uniref:hypothetical protein n=1 Tax=Bdellovibrio sp. HCB2-146 TaxID=3394362 RepID=UPI0039BC2E93